MEYPGARFTRPVRLTMLILFMAAFFSLSPAVVLFAAGYRFDWQHGLLRETGGLSIDFTPTKNASVWLDGQPLDESVPAQLKNITPKNYHVALHAPGYYTWEKDITISPRQTTYIKDITLIKQSSGVMVSTSTAQSLSVSPNNRYVLFSKDSNDRHDFYVIDQKSNTTLFVTTITSSLPLVITWGTGNVFSITDKTSTAPHTTFTIGSAANPEDTAHMLGLTNEPITKYVWRTTGDPTLYLSTSSTIFSYSPLLRQKQIIAANTFQDWFVANDVLWTLDRTTSTLIINRDRLGFDERFAVVTTSSTHIAEDFFTPSNWIIAKVHNDTVLLREKNRSQMLLVQKNKQYPLDADDFSISRFNDWWLFTTPSEIWSFNEEDAPSLLLRSGALIEGVTPIDAENTLALQYNHSLHILFPYEYVEQKLLDEHVLRAAADQTRRRLYYSTESGLYSLDY